MDDAKTALASGADVALDVLELLTDSLSCPLLTAALPLFQNTQMGKASNKHRQKNLCLFEK